MLEVAMPQSIAGPIAGSTAVPAAPPAPAESHVTFREILSELNPLQYLPVIGTIYRAVTGDQIPEVLRRIGSIIVSGLIAGPVGVAISVATTVAEKLTGIDLDKTGQAWLAGGSVRGAPVSTAPALAQATESPAAASATTAGGGTLATGTAGAAAASSATPTPTPTPAPARTMPADAQVPLGPASASPAVASPEVAPPAVASAAATAWSPAQLAAYGVSTAADGSLRLGSLQGADVLNALELSRIQVAQAAYDRTSNLAAATAARAL